MIHQILHIFSDEDRRTCQIKRNILGSAVLKSIGMLASFLIVPVTLGYLNSEVYGIWLTMSSVLYWISFSDIGLGNGMRNYLTGAISRGNWDEARMYVSTTVVILSIIALVFGVISYIAISLLDLGHFFNTRLISEKELSTALTVAVMFTLVNFVVKNIGMIFVALQHYAVNDLLVVSGNVIALILVYILTQTVAGSLVNVVLIFTATPVLVFALSAVPIFRRYPQLRPSFKEVDMNIARRITAKGLGFFAIQITSCLVIFGSSNIFITQYCGPESVTVYNIAYKWFNIIVIAYTIVISPMWNAYTDAYVKNDMPWIDNTFRKAMKIWALTAVAGILMLAGSGLFYGLWVGDSVSVPFTVSASVLVYLLMFNLNSGITCLLNGLNKIKVQIYTSVAFTAIYLAVVNISGERLGIEGIVSSMALCYAAMAAIHLYQCRLLTKGKAKGIWNK